MPKATPVAARLTTGRAAQRTRHSWGVLGVAGEVVHLGLRGPARGAQGIRERSRWATRSSGRGAAAVLPRPETMAPGVGLVGGCTDRGQRYWRCWAAVIWSRKVGSISTEITSMSSVRSAPAYQDLPRKFLAAASSENSKIFRQGPSRTAPTWASFKASLRTLLRCADLGGPHAPASGLPDVGEAARLASFEVQAVSLYLLDQWTCPTEDRLLVQQRADLALRHQERTNTKT